MLKKTFLFLFLTSYSFAIPINDDPSFKDIYKKHSSDKITLMIYTAASCPQCAYMKQKVFKEKHVKSFLSHNFVILEKDVHKDELPNGFDYFGIPTIYFIDSNGTSIGKFVGSSRAQPFLQQLKQVKKEQENK